MAACPPSASMCARWAGHLTALRPIAWISSRRHRFRDCGEIDFFCLASDKREERDRECRGDGNTSERVREVAAISGGEHALDRRVGRGEEIPQLINKPRKRSARLMRRHLVQVR